MVIAAFAIAAGIGLASDLRGRTTTRARPGIEADPAAIAANAQVDRRRIPR